MHYPSTRLFSVLELLQTHDLITGAKIAAQLEVDGRTVRRYITLLQEMGLPVETVQGRNGGYRLQRRYRLPPLVFQSDEVLALALGLMLTRRLGMAQMIDAADQAIAKIEAIMPAALLQQIKTLNDVLLIDPPQTTYHLSSDILLTLSQAVYERRAVWMVYTGRSQQQTRRKIDPYHLVFMIGFWYVVGYCHLRGGLRVFRIDRVQEAALLLQTFETPAAFDVQQFVEDSIAKTPNAWSIRVLLHTDLATARRQIPRTMAFFREEEQGVEMQATAGNLQDLALRLLGMSVPFSILEPAELKDAFRQVAERAAAISQSGVSTGNS